jgi:biotin carboxyl carrier protein
MKLKARSSGAEHQLEIAKSGRTVTASVDGRTYELDVTELEPGVFLIKHEGRVIEASTTRQPDGSSITVSIGGTTIDVALFDPRKLPLGTAGAAAADGAAEIKTAMPGKIVRIIAAAGTEVEKGDGVIVVEAMKMQNELKSPKQGVVKEVRAAEGATVNAGDVLAIIE